MEVSHEPWNKGRAQGQKEPLTPEQVGADVPLEFHPGGAGVLAVDTVAAG
jgi:hypothetical protein